MLESQKRLPFYRHLLRIQAQDAPLAQQMAGIGGHNFVEGSLAHMAEGGMAQIMTQDDGLDQIQIQIQCPAHGPGNLGHLQGVGQPGAQNLILAGGHQLGLARQTAEGTAVEDLIPVKAKDGFCCGQIVHSPQELAGKVRIGGNRAGNIHRNASILVFSVPL